MTVNTPPRAYADSLRLSVAPMLDWTDRHCRYFHRLLAPGARMYSEMMHANAILHGDRERHLGHDASDNPVALQLGGSDPALLAQAALAEALDAEVRASTAQLIELHGLAGHAQAEVLQRMAEHFELQLRMDESKAALVGGALTGALVGLKADVVAGGLTLGGGLLAGGLLGALGAAGLARAVNLVRGTGKSWVAWNDAALNTMLEAALLRYLAVAHFGRGRGEWERAESAPHWPPLVRAALADEAEALRAIWAERDGGDGGDAALALRLRAPIHRLLRATLQRLYPQSPLPDSPLPNSPPVDSLPPD